MTEIKHSVKRIYCGIAVLLACGALPRGDAQQPVRFNRDIRPILSANCFLCHGPDAKHREAELRLDQQDGIKQAFDGKLDGSEAWMRINSDDPDLQMPPPGSHKELTKEQITLIGRWIEQGANWEGHWSFIAPKKPAVPRVKNMAWAHNEIDAFILARLEREGLSPSAEATRERLLRRVHMDLIGLPPTIDEIDAFVNDKSPNAYEKVVDRLLASKHFGERMALMWMDAARYGDSSVFHADGPRDMWAWRDWVIHAYNANKPFDQFTIEQLAGDHLPEASMEQKVATGFLRNNATTDEGGAIAEEYRVEYAVDRVKTTAMVWMGLSLECAQCHDHKYDPFTMRDYYQIFAYFNQAADPGMQSRRGNQAPIVNVMDSNAEVEKFKQELAELQRRQAARAKEAETDFAAWTEKAAANAKQGPILPGNMLLHYPFDDQGSEVTNAQNAKQSGKVNGQANWTEGKFGGALQSDNDTFADLGDVANFERDQAFSFGAWMKPKGQASGAPIARMNNGNSYRGFDLYCAGGQVAVHIINTWPTNAVKVTTNAKLKPNQWQHVFATYDGSSKAHGIKIYFDGKEQPWRIEQDRLSGTIRTKVPLYVGRRNPGPAFQGAIDDVRFYGRALTPAEVAALSGSDPIGPIMALSPQERTPQQIDTLRNHFLNTHDKPYIQLSQQIGQLNAKIAAAKKPVTSVMVMQDVPKMRRTYMLDRGHYASPLKDKPVNPGVPAALPPLPDGAEPNRLGLAKWLVQPNHPLTARVAVNRYWYMLFGTGIVKTLEDFGAQGDWPSHPDLLDWLAVDFVESGWNIKRTLKQIVMSATYRQSSRATKELLERAPENRLLARGPRFRLQAEFIRDNALAAGGLLVDKIGGPSVKPYQPPGLWNEVSLSGNVRFVQDKGEKLYRRSMYTYWKRSAPAPAMTIFDATTREKCVLRRSRTNTPLQALVTLNDPQFVEASRMLAQRAMNAGGKTTDDQIVYAYRLATGVRPNMRVLGILKQAFQEELAVFQQDAERAKQFLSIGEAPRDANLDTATHAAMTIVTSMILNLDETITRG